MIHLNHVNMSSNIDIIQVMGKEPFCLSNAHSFVIMLMLKTYNVETSGQNSHRCFNWKRNIVETIFIS